MKALIKVWIGICFISITSTAYSQSKLAAIGVLNFPDSIGMNQSFSFDVIIKNNDLQNTFNGSIDIQYQTHLMDSLNISPDTGINISNNIIAAGGTDTLHITNVDVDPARFKTGNNTILIWPMANLSEAGDTLVHSIYVELAAGIEEEKKENESIELYPNPAEDHIYIRLKRTDHKQLEKVRIYNIVGVVVSEESYGENRPISVGFLPSGNYFIEIRTMQGDKIVKRFSKQ